MCKNSDSFYAGMLAALAVVALHDNETIFHEIVELDDAQALVAFAKRDGQLEMSGLARYGYDVPRDGARNCANGAHNFLGVFCAVPGCGRKRSGGSDYCKKHDMRFRRHGDVNDRPRGRPRKGVL